MILDSKPAELREDPCLSWYDGHGKLTWSPASVRFCVTRHRLLFPSDFGTLRVLSVFTSYRLEWRLGELPEAVPAESRAQRRGRACWEGLPSGLCPAPPAVWLWRCCCSGHQEGLRRPALSAFNSSPSCGHRPVLHPYLHEHSAGGVLARCLRLSRPFQCVPGSSRSWSVDPSPRSTAEGEQTHRRPQNL